MGRHVLITIAAAVALVACIGESGQVAGGAEPPAPVVEPPEVEEIDEQPVESNEACLAADLDGSGIVDQDDLALLNLSVDLINGCIGTDLSQVFACGEFDDNADGIVGITDFFEVQQEYQIFLSCYGKLIADSPDCIPADFNFDGAVGIADYLEFGSGYQAFMDCYATDLRDEALCLPSDLDGDGLVTDLDAAMLAAQVAQLETCAAQGVD